MVFAALIGGLVGARGYWLADAPERGLRRRPRQRLRRLGARLVRRRSRAARSACCCGRWRKGMFNLELLDTARRALAMGYAVGRVGCQISGDGDYGKATDLPWGMAYPDGVVPTTEVVHPTPIYETLVDGPRRLGAVARCATRSGPACCSRCYLVLVGRRALPRRVRAPQRAGAGRADRGAAREPAGPAAAGVAWLVRPARSGGAAPRAPLGGPRRRSASVRRAERLDRRARAARAARAPPGRGSAASAYSATAASATEPPAAMSSSALATSPSTPARRAERGARATSCARTLRPSRSAAAAGATSSAKTSRLPRLCTAATTATPSSASSASSTRAGPHAERRRRDRVEDRDARARGGRRRARRATSAASAARGDEVGRARAEQVAEQQLAEPRRDVGREREHRAEAERRRDGDADGDLRADARVARRERDQRRGDEHAAGRAEQQRRADERRDHEPRQHRVRERLGGVGLAQVQQPDAERAARRAEHDDLERARAAAARSGGSRPVSASWCWTATARWPQSSTTISAP